MTRLLFVIPFVVPFAVMTSAASAQQKQGQDACARDAQRFCRAHLNEGDQVVLACLKQNRAKLGKACQQMLTSHGQ